MSTNPSSNPDPNNQPSSQPPYASWREQRRTAREARRAERFGSRGGAWMFGAILIVVGIVFLLQSMGAVIGGNWWALFILLPAAGAFGAAWRNFSWNGGQLSGAVLGPLIAGLVFTVLAFAFLVNLNLTFIGPVLLIVFGFGLLAAAFLRPGAS